MDHSKVLEYLRERLDQLITLFSMRVKKYREPPTRIFDIYINGVTKEDVPDLYPDFIKHVYQINQSILNDPERPKIVISRRKRHSCHV